MQINSKPAPKFTHEGAKASHINAELQLRRSVLSTLLFENQFYESGEEIGKRIASLIKNVDPRKCRDLVIEAREKMLLRHVPLLIIREMARIPTHKKFVARLLDRVITRPDMLADFLALYWADGKQPLSAKVKQGLAFAFNKFTEYQLKKHLHNDRAVKLRDVLFMCHAKPKDAIQDVIWKRLINNELVAADTWETALAGGANKRETFERLIRDGKLGAMAFLRNLRNMQVADVDIGVIVEYSRIVKTGMILPYRYIAAAKEAPVFESMLEKMMQDSLVDKPKLSGRTILLVDVSGSMDQAMSAKSKMTYLDAACAIAMLALELVPSEFHMKVFTFSHNLVEVPPRRGFALRDAIVKSQDHGGTALAHAISTLNQAKYVGGQTPDRIIVITDEQASPGNLPQKLVFKHPYLINVASAKNGIGYHLFNHIDGFSASVLDWIKEYEASDFSTLLSASGSV